MILALFLGQQAIAEVGPFESAQLMDTAHAPRQGDIFVRPLGVSTLGLNDRLAIGASAVDWVTGTPNVSSEFNIVDNWAWALSVTPYLSTDYQLQTIRSGATFIHSLQYEQDRLNTSVRLGFVGERGGTDIEAVDIETISTGILEGEVGLSYDFVMSRSLVHRIKGSISGSMAGIDSLQASAGYSLHAALGDSARLELGVDVGEPSTVYGELFNAHLREQAYGEELAGQVWMPTPSASLFWVF